MKFFFKIPTLFYSLAVIFLFVTTFLYVPISKGAENSDKIMTVEKLTKTKSEKKQAIKDFPQLIDKYFFHISVFIYTFLLLLGIFVYFGHRVVYRPGIKPGEKRNFLYIWSLEGPPLEQNPGPPVSSEDREIDLQSLSSISPQVAALFENVESKKPSEAEALLNQKDHQTQEISVKANNLFDEGKFLDGFSLLEKNGFNSEELALKALLEGVEKEHPEGIKKLRMLAENNPENEDVHFWYSFALKTGSDDDFPENLKKIESILENVSKESIYVKYISAKSEIIRKKESLNESIQFLKKELEIIIDRKNKAYLLDILARCYFEKYGEQCWQGIACLETAKKNDPRGTYRLFDLAHKYSQINKNSLSLFQYNCLIEVDKNYKYALNNAGACSERLNLPFSAVEYYEKAWQESKETYSAANLAYLYMSKGFYIEAANLIKEAQNEDNYEDRVDEAINHLKKNKKEEIKKKYSVINEGREYSKWIEKISYGLLDSDIELSLVMGEYEGKNRKIKILSGDSGEMFLSDLANELTSNTNIKKIVLDIIVEGSVIIFSWGEENYISLLGTHPKTGSGLLVFNKNEKNLEGFYTESNNKNKLFQWNLKKIN